MGDNYETLDTYQNVNPPPIPAKSNEQSPLIEVSPLPDPESDLLKSRTDLYSKKFAAESKHYLIVSILLLHMEPNLLVEFAN
uniref:Uncharacterized protein n=1 Tax=Setaria digitata TaxID=48799 RepID=A0A915PU22_9BILA